MSTILSDLSRTVKKRSSNVESRVSHRKRIQLYTISVLEWLERTFGELISFCGTTHLHQYVPRESSSSRVLALVEFFWLRTCLRSPWFLRWSRTFWTNLIWSSCHVILYRLNQLCISIASENIIPCGDQIHVSLTAGPKLLTYPWMLAIDSSSELLVRPRVLAYCLILAIAWVFLARSSRLKRLTRVCQYLTGSESLLTFKMAARLSSPLTLGDETSNTSWTNLSLD